MSSAKRLLLHTFAIQEYLITHSSLNTHSLISRRNAMADQIRLNNPRVLSPRRSIEASQLQQASSVDALSRRFAASLGQYLMFIYLFGIGDRHNDNVMLNNQGYFHIDFGHILGHYKHKLGIAREKHAFLFTKAYYNVLGGENHPYFTIFMENAMACYRTVREHVYLFFALLELLRDSGIDEIVDDKDTSFLLNACRLDGRSGFSLYNESMRRKRKPFSGVRSCVL